MWNLIQSKIKEKEHQSIWCYEKIDPEKLNIFLIDYETGS